MLVQLYFNSQHYNAWNLKEVKSVMVISLVNNCNLLHIILWQACYLAYFNILYQLCTKRMRSVHYTKTWLKSRQVSNNTSHLLLR